MRGTVPGLGGGQRPTCGERHRCLTSQGAGEMSPAWKHRDGKKVSLRGLPWGLSLQGGGERYWH